MRDGVIADYLITEAMLRYFIGKVVGSTRCSGPWSWSASPPASPTSRAAPCCDATIQAGAKEAHLIAEPLAAAIGANIPISSPSGNMIVDIGGGTHRGRRHLAERHRRHRSRCASAATRSTR